MDLTALMNFLNREVKKIFFSLIFFQESSLNLICAEQKSNLQIYSFTKLKLNLQSYLQRFFHCYRLNLMSSNDNVPPLDTEDQTNKLRPVCSELLAQLTIGVNHACRNTNRFITEIPQRNRFTAYFSFAFAFIVNILTIIPINFSEVVFLMKNNRIHKAIFILGNCLAYSTESQAISLTIRRR